MRTMSYTSRSLHKSPEKATSSRLQTPTSIQRLRNNQRVAADSSINKSTNRSKTVDKSNHSIPETRQTMMDSMQRSASSPEKKHLNNKYAAAGEKQMNQENRDPAEDKNNSIRYNKRSAADAVSPVKNGSSKTNAAAKRRSLSQLNGQKVSLGSPVTRDTTEDHRYEKDNSNFQQTYENPDNIMHTGSKLLSTPDHQDQHEKPTATSKSLLDIDTPHIMDSKLTKPLEHHWNRTNDSANFTEETHNKAHELSVLDVDLESLDEPPKLSSLDTEELDLPPTQQVDRGENEDRKGDADFKSSNEGQLGQEETNDNTYNNISLEDKIRADYQTEIHSLVAELEGKQAELEALKDRLRKSEEQSTSNERLKKELIEKVAQQLHVQYSQKHLAKVNALKQNYDNKWNHKVQILQNKISTLQQEVETERREKDELVKACDMYLSMETEQ